MITDHRDMNGKIRMLARLRPGATTLRKRAGMTSFAEYVDSVNKDSRIKDGILPRRYWQPIDRSKTLGEDFLLDQYQCSGCVGYSAAMALMRERALRGMEFYRLSGSSVYARINGGRDQGAIITDALDALKQYGACLEDEFDYPQIMLRDLPSAAVKTALRFRLEDGLTLSSFDEMGTALQLGFIVQFPIQVGDHFEKFSRDGVCGFDSGPGNHSVHADGMAFVNGLWVFDMPNSWSDPRKGDFWGPRGDGRAFVSERTISGCAQDEDAYTHVLPRLDPDEEQDMP